MQNGGVGAGGLTLGATGANNGSIILSNGSNSYTGVLTVAGGIAQVTTAGAFGTVAGNTSVNAGGTLDIEPGLTVTENFSLNGAGFQNILSALRIPGSVGGNTVTTLSGTLAFAATGSINVERGGATPDHLVTSGVVSSGSGITTKRGAGEWEISGASDNTAFDDGLTILNGTVRLNKAGTAQAIAGAGAITIGDGTRLSGSARLILIGAGTNQIGGTMPIVVGASGLLDLNGINETINNTLTLQRLGSTAVQVQTGAGTLTLGGTVTVNDLGTSGMSSAAATISGNLSLNNAARSFTVNDARVPDSGDDLIISAVISGGGALTKDGYGTLVLTGNNTYTGATIINTGTFVEGITRFGGSLVLRGHGSIAQSSSVTVQYSASLVLDNRLGLSLNPEGRIGNVTVTVNGGELVHIGHDTDAVNEVIGNLTINAPGATAGGGYSQIRSVHVGADLALTTAGATGLTRNGGSTLRFVAEGSDLGSAVHRIQFTGTVPGTSNETLTWATLDQASTADLEFVTHGANGIDDAAFVTSLAAATPTSNVKLSASEAAAAPQTINALMLTGNGIAVTGSALTVTGGQVVNTGGNNSIANDLAFGTVEGIFLVEAATRLVASGAISGTAASRKEGNGTLRLSGNNGFTGAFTIGDGTVEAANSAAFGTPAGGTFVHATAALVVDAAAGSLNFGNEAITLNGTGVDNDNLGALKLVGGNAIVGTGATAFTLNQATVISVESGRTLDLNANVTGNNTLTKQGCGVLEFSGGTANASTGARIINEGTLRLNKTGAAVAVNGALTVGNFAGTANVIYAATAGTDQIGNVALTVRSGGGLNLNNISDTINSNLTMLGGTVDTGSGVLTLGGDIIYNTGGPAVINGLLNLNNGTRTITVADGQDLNDLTINAAISNGRLIKAGAGLLLLNNSANSFLPGINEVQRVAIAGSTAGTSTFTINFNGNVTGNIVVNAADATTASLIDAALEALPNIGVGGGERDGCGCRPV